MIKAEFRIDRGALKRAAAAAKNDSVAELREFAAQESGMDFELDASGNVVGATVDDSVDMPPDFEAVCEQLAPYVRKGSFPELEIEGGVSRMEFDGESCDCVDVEQKPKRSWFRSLLGR